MTAKDKERLCDALRGVVNIGPSMDPMATLAALQRPQTATAADVPGILRKVETVKNHLYEAATVRTMMYVEKALSREELFRLAYVPFVIAELVWDYADTIINTASRLDCPDTRRICRAIRKLKQEYDRTRYHFIGDEERAREMDNAEIFEDIIAGHVSQMMMHIRLAMDNDTPDLLPDWRTMLTAVHQCRVLSQALMLYTSEQEARTARRIGKPIGRILPPQSYALHDLLPEFFGDMPPGKRLTETLNQYARTFAARMGAMEFNDTTKGQEKVDVSDFSSKKSSKIQ